MLSRAWHRVRASSSTLAAGEGTRVEVDSAQCRGWNPTAQGPLVTVGPVAPPRPWRLLLCSSCGSRGTHQLCSAVGEDADSWECGDCSGTGTGEGCSRGDRVPRATWPPQPAGIWGEAQGCDPRREGGWHGLVLIISLPLAVPTVEAVADSSPPAPGPSRSAPAPGTLAEVKEAGVLEGHPDSQLPSEPMSNERADLP